MKGENSGVKHLRDYLINCKFIKVLLKEPKRMSYLYEGNLEGIPAKCLGMYVLEHTRLKAKRVMFLLVPDADVYNEA